MLSRTARLTAAMATNRLRQKLRDVEDAELVDLTENFCIIGTPLPDLTSKRDSNELRPIWQQEARDAQGRRRFHGAFTGGFSAGYFNTVGSKEGWTPSSFRSSRADKKKGTQLQTISKRPEDFMDEEDLEDWRAAQQLSTSTLFGGDSGNASNFADSQKSAVVGSLINKQEEETASSTLLTLLRSERADSFGVRLLKRMGWKDGQGLGPKVDAYNRAQLRRLLAGEVEGSSELSDAVSSEELKHLHAPPLTPLVGLADRQGTRVGLGFDHKAHLNENAYPADTVENKGSSTQVIRSSSDVWPDGSQLPPGFHISLQVQTIESDLPLEPVPADWSPNPTKVWKAQNSALGTASPSSHRLDHLSPASRGQLLGESRIPGPPPSISNFLSAKARERLATTASVQLPATSGQATGVEQVSVPRIDPTTARRALSSFAPFSSNTEKQERYQLFLKGQLDSKSQTVQQWPIPPHMTAEECSNELREFAKSAAIFQPMSSAIADRFTSASAAVLAHEANATTSSPGLRNAGPGAAIPPETAHTSAEHVEDPAAEELSIAQKAAKMNNFGHLTRQVETWVPARLLCKRFGLPEPRLVRTQDDEAQPNRAHSSNNMERDPDDQYGNDPFYGSTRVSKGRAAGVRVDQHWERSKEQLKALAASLTPLSRVRSSGISDNVERHEGSRSDTAEIVGEVGLGDDERQGRDTLTYVKPSIDVFKAIFASDEDSDVESSPSAQASSEMSRPMTTTRPKMQDPAAGSGVVFRARAKRKDSSNDLVEAKLHHPPGSQSEKRRKGEKKRKAPTKSLLTFDMDDGESVQEVLPHQPVLTKGRSKARTRASDLF